MPVTIAYSPCPNDTFMFHGIASGRIPLPAGEPEAHLHDVQTLNELAQAGRFDVSKVSFYASLMVQEDYRMLRVGAALGFGCGPLLIARESLTRDRLASCRVAIPGELTTAHLLFQLWAPTAEQRVFVPYDQVMPMVERGEVDAGVIIHEGRFVYEQKGLHAIVDLGEWWEGETSLPIPLGGIVVRRSLGDSFAQNFESALAASIRYAQENPEASRDYVHQYAQELSDDVLDSHIETYVNRYSLDMGADGAAAVEKLESMARSGGLLA